MNEVHDQFVIRRARPDEISIFRAWATAEGWNPGLHDGSCFFATDPDGFFIGERNDEPIACISCVAYDSSFGFLGHYIVRPDFRGQGYGMQIWRAGMDYLADRNVGLDGVVAQIDNYRKSGFHVAYSNIRYRVAGGGTAVPGVVPLAEVPFDELLAYDSNHFPAARPGFLRTWISLPGTTALGVVKGGNLVGYGVIRPVTEGFRVGPLFADHPEIADSLFRGLLANAPGQPVFIDAPDESANPHIIEFIRPFAGTEAFRTARMYTKIAPALSLEQIFGVTSLELG